MAGLLFADDLVVLAPSRRRLVRMLGALDEWADRNEMSFGISKCGVMGVSRDGLGLNDRLRGEADRWQLGGANVPIVDSYQYLGMIFTPTLSTQAMVDDRVAKGWRAYHALRPVLECTRIPLAIRVRLVKATLLPTVMYGAELWGMSAQRCSRAESLLREVLRSLLRLGRRSTITSSMTLGLELSIPPVHARASATRARAFHKYASLRTVVAGLVSRPTSAGVAQRSWTMTSRAWLRRFCPAPPAMPPAQVAQGAQAPPDAPWMVANRVRAAVWESMAGHEGGRSLARYRQQGFEASNGYIWQAVKYPALATGVHWLTRARVGAIWVGVAYARIRWLPAEFLTRCPFCGHGDGGEAGVAGDNAEGVNVAHGGGHDGETLPHLLLECPRWDEFRVLLRPLIDEARARLGAGGNADTLATYLLGGRVRGAHEDAQDIWCRHWVSLGRVQAPQNGDGGLVDDGVNVQMQHDAPALAEAEAEHGAAGANVDDRVPGFVLVARFLQAVMPARFAELGPLLSPPRADAGHGMAAFPQQAGGNHPHPLGGDDAPP